MNIPKIDKRDSNDILKEIKSLANQYVPEWNFDKEDPDFGVVFSKIFANMMETSITRYNRSLYNYYLTFLNLLGVKLLPAISSTGMITVDVTPGSDGSYIEKGTSVYAAADNAEGRVFYQTKDTMYAIDNRINSIYMADGKTGAINEIYSISPDDSDNKLPKFRIFDSTTYDDLQEHIIYFKSDYIFKTKESSDIIIKFYDNQSKINNDNLASIFNDSENVTWQYFKDNKWRNIQNVSKDNNGIRLKFEDSSDKCELNGELTYFIRCLFKKIPENDLYMTSASYESRAKDLQPDTVLSSTSELSKVNFFPFGEQYSLYTDFYIASDEAFSKKGAKINIKFDMKFLKAKINTDQMPDNTRYRYVMTELDFQDPNSEESVQIEKVIWEYWNGFGWAKLYQDDNNENFFLAEEGDFRVKEITFMCPDDMQSLTIGPAERVFIRARIVKIKNGFNVFANYITPYVSNISIDYNYLNDGCSCDRVLVKSNLKDSFIELSGKSREIVLKNDLLDKPVMYWCLDRPIDKAPVKLFIDVEKRVTKDNPSLIWEYYSKDKNGKYVWKNIEIMDLTNNFSHSAVSTIIGKNNFAQTTIFGKTGYFIRIVNHDEKYSTTEGVESHPIINGIYFNTVDVVQIKDRNPEYFYIELGEKNKVCNLSSKSISNARVWVNEIGSLSVLEEANFVEDNSEKCKKVYDGEGRIKEIWVEWKPVNSISAAGENDRVFEIDYNKGEIIFGDGRYGKIPTHQDRDSIRVEYSISEGEAGNIEKNEILGFSDSVSSINNVTNLKPMVGGINMETIDFAAKRMSGTISGMDRIVTLSDFENCIAYNDRNINKVKCIPHINELNEEEKGTISIAILPNDYMQGYEKFLALKQRVQEYIVKKAPLSLVNNNKIKIFETMYAEISVSVDVVANDYNNYQKTYQEVYSRLKQFLDPISGNFDSKGWQIGKLPRKELIYNYIKMTPNVKWIKNINLFTKIITKNGKKEVDFDEVKNQKFAVPVFGEPEINISVE